jgi:hypothetical protein
MLHLELEMDKIKILPLDLIEMVYEYVPISVLLMCDKKKYIEHHSLLKKNILKHHHYENYVRDMIRKDCDFVFSFLLEENYQRWFDMKKYVYKNNLYANYLHFLKDYCIVKVRIIESIILIVELNE